MTDREIAHKIAHQVVDETFDLIKQLGVNYNQKHCELIVAKMKRIFDIGFNAAAGFEALGPVEDDKLNPPVNLPHRN